MAYLRLQLVWSIEIKNQYNDRIASIRTHRNSRFPPLIFIAAIKLKQIPRENSENTSNSIGNCR